MKKCGSSFYFLLCSLYIMLPSLCTAQQLHLRRDSIPAFRNRPALLHVLVPSILIGYGFMGHHNVALGNFHTEIREEVMEHVDEYAGIDNFMQYAPPLSVYALNAIGVQGRHSFHEATLLLGTSWLIMGTAVTGVKEATRIERPDGSARNSFPSGHTATAFMGA